MYGDVVAAARHSRGLTQTQLAAASGIEQANISAIERGHRLPSAATFHRLLHACGYELTASAGTRTIACPPPADDSIFDDLLRRGSDEPATVTSDMPIATRVRVLTAVLDAAEAVTRSR